MDVGQCETAQIAARAAWNRTGIILQAGHTYSMTASGEWFDWRNVCGPDGYPSPNWLFRLAEPLRRARHEQWFTLIGALDRDKRTLFRIGTSCGYTAQRSGELTCFANDLSLFYLNNRGRAALSVLRTG
jgi:hypothetical protein